MNNFRLQSVSAKNPEVGLLLSVLQDGTREWTEEFYDAADDLVNFRLVSGGHCFGGILLHIMAAERYWVDEVIFDLPVDLTDPATAYDEVLDQDGCVWPDAPIQTLDWYFELFKKHRARTIELLIQVENPLKIIQQHERADYSISWIIGHLIQHDSYHGGQCVMLNEFHKKTKQIENK